jgi:protein-S-isoprenylcysteine O-methyltransferase Ste14
MSEAVRVFLATLGYGALHSLLASRTVKRSVRNRIGPVADRLYRLGFNAVAILTFFPVLLVLAGNIGTVLFIAPMPWAAGMAAVQLAAVLLLGACFLTSDPLYFIGLRQLGDDDPAPRLVVSGASRIVRHPLFSAALLVFWCFPVLTTGTLAFDIAATLYILVGSEWEERKLAEEFGEAYIRYRSKVARWIPFIF